MNGKALTAALHPPPHSCTKDFSSPVEAGTIYPPQKDGRFGEPWTSKALPRIEPSTSELRVQRAYLNTIVLIRPQAWITTWAYGAAQLEGPRGLEAIFLSSLIISILHFKQIVFYTFH